MIQILIVSYEVPINEAKTFFSLRKIFEGDEHLAASFRVHVWDNSSKNRFDDTTNFFKPIGVDYEYTSTPQNLSLSHIYNRCLASPGPCGYLMILDQDTGVTETYLRESLIQTSQGYQLILPRVYANGVLVSPATRYYCKGRLLKSIQAGPAASANLLAINSGMIISFSVFSKFAYHPDLRFYGTDTWFMVNYEKYFPVASIMVSELDHSLHINSSPDRLWMKSYFQEQIRVNRIIFSDHWGLRILTWFYNLYLKIGHT